MTIHSVSVVVPVYKSAQTLLELHRRLVEVLQPLTSSLEIIFVDDGGGDDSWSVITQISQSDHRVLGFQHSRNYGQHNALLTGIRAASHEVIVTLDDDLQNPPEEIPKMLAVLDLGYDVVYGTPELEQHGQMRDMASRITKIALQIAMGADTGRNFSAFRVFRTFLRDAFSDYRNPFVSIDVLLTWGTTSFSSVRVRHEPRKVGVSNYTFGKLVRHALNMMTGFSVLPLQFASLIGFFFTIVGFGLLSYVLVNYLLHGSTVAGFAFIASMVALFSGAQMLAIGIIGEYLARMHMRSMGRPAGVVRQSVGIGLDSTTAFQRSVGVKRESEARTGGRVISL